MNLTLLTIEKKLTSVCGLSGLTAAVTRGQISFAGAKREDLAGRGVDHARDRQRIEADREDHDPNVEGIAYIEVTAVPSEAGRSLHGIGRGRRIVRNEIRLAEHQIRGCRVRGRNLVEDQDPVIAAIGDEQPAIGCQNGFPGWFYNPKINKLYLQILSSKRVSGFGTCKP